ncbi:MAG: hypothetical protein NC039_09105 [Muribaculaceae bacterium]|nr:hypothetical protein [Muribaculaceae bacterium]
MKHLKQEFDKLTIRELLTYFIAMLLMASAIVAVFLGMYIPPEGEVHDSILVYYGISSASASSLLGISMHYQNKLEDFKAQVRDWLTANLPPKT